MFVSEKMVNITWFGVNAKVEEVLQTYPEYPYRDVFANPRLRDRLVAYVLNYIPNRYVRSKNPQKLGAQYNCLFSPDEQAYIEKLIRHGISQLLRSHEDWLERYVPQSEPTDAHRVPSHWFG
jgi:hypothetical protein